MGVGLTNMIHLGQFRNMFASNWVWSQKLLVHQNANTVRTVAARAKLSCANPGIAKPSQ